jgi:hypothetical protein
MREYKVYCLDESGRIVMWVSLNCADDRDALKRAREFCGDCDVELWQDDRKLYVVGRDMIPRRVISDEA